MAGGYVTPAGDVPDRIVQELRELRSRVRELEKPTGTQSASTVAYLKSLITLGDEGTSFDSGDIPGTGTTIEIVPADPPEIAGFIAATGRIQVVSGCGEVSIRPGNGAAIAYIDFRALDPDGNIVPLGVARFARIFSEANRNFGVSLSVNHTATVPSDIPLTIRARYNVWSTSTAPLAGVTFNDPYLSVQVISPE